MFHVDFDAPCADSVDIASGRECPAIRRPGTPVYDRVIDPASARLDRARAKAATFS